ncbi:MAG: L,D-transpeptidase family protein [Actinomycetota bacterium]
MRRLILTMATAVAVLATLVPVAAAGPGAGSVTIKAARTRIKFGQWVRIEGRARPAVDNELVTIIDREEGPIAQTRTNEDGRYGLWLQPRENLKIRARTLTAKSTFVPIKVAAIVKVGLRKVNLFGRARTSGSVKPAQPGKKAVVRLYRNDKLAQKKKVRLQNGRRFRAGFDIRKPGSFKAKVSFGTKDLNPGSDASGKRRTRLPALAMGSRGSYVKRLEKRLIQLGYVIPLADKSFGEPTRDAMYAFNKIQRRARTGNVTESTWRALARPKRPKPRVRSPRNHIEIDQTRQVVMWVRKGKVKWILHTSTGAGGATRDGVFRMHRKVAGYSPNRLYYPSYFDGLRAIHGWPEVPNYPASHGCARIPMWAAVWAYNNAPIGKQVRVYH